MPIPVLGTCIVAVAFPIFFYLAYWLALLAEKRWGGSSTMGSLSVTILTPGYKALVAQYEAACDAMKRFTEAFHEQESEKEDGR